MGFPGTYAACKSKNFSLLYRKTSSCPHSRNGSCLKFAQPFEIRHVKLVATGAQTKRLVDDAQCDLVGWAGFGERPSKIHNSVMGRLKIRPINIVVARDTVAKTLLAIGFTFVALQIRFSEIYW